MFKKSFLRIVGLAIIATLTLGLLVACRNDDAPADPVDEPDVVVDEVEDEEDDVEEPAPPADGDGITLRFMQGKVEIDGQLRSFAQDHYSRTGVMVQIESIGGGADYFGTLLQYMAAGNMPDLFSFETMDAPDILDLFHDLSGSPIVDASDYVFFDADGRAIGAPFSIEGLGLIYNADILAQAGIDPDQLLTYQGVRDAFETIDGMLDELGLQAVASVAAESGNMWWSSRHMLGSFLTLGQDQDDKSIIDDFKNGIVDRDRFEAWADYIALLYEFADPHVLVSGDYDAQLALFATGGTAFVTQGNWIDPTLIGQFGVEFDAGIVPYSFLSTPTPGAIADSPSFWAVYTGGDHVEEAMAFLNDLLLSEEGARLLVEEAGMISAIRDVELLPTMPVSANLAERVNQGPTFAWDWLTLTTDLGMNHLGLIHELFASGQIDRDGFVDMMITAIEDFYGN